MSATADQDRDSELVTKFRTGDRDAFTSLYRLYQPAVFRFLLRMTGDSAKAMELVQDTFVWFIHHPGNFDPERGRLDAFLIGVARKLLQKSRHEQMRWTPIDAKHPAERQQEPDDDVESLRNAIAALPEAYRAVVVLCDLEQNTYEEAAGILECAVGTVRSRLHRARALLARKIGQQQETQRCSI